MDRLPIFRSKSDSMSSMSTTSSFTSTQKGEWLPAPAQSRQKVRLRALLGHCLYRRVILWTLAVITLGFWVFFTRRGGSFDLARLGTDLPEETKEQSKGDNEGRDPLHWLKYKHLDGYYRGLRTLVPISEHKPEFPFVPGRQPATTTVTSAHLPTPTVFVPQPDYESKEYKSTYHPVQTCYIDENKKVPAPDLYAYNGVPQGMPDPAIGSNSLLGIRDDVCFDRFSRYGPYGLGYSEDEGGLGEGMDTESDGSETVWSKTGKIDYRNVDWGRAQQQCVTDNRKRFDINAGRERKKVVRIAVVIRTYVGFEWNTHAIMNFRAMVSELSLRSGGEYTVHFLLHVKDNNLPIWADSETRQQILDESMPREFHSMCTLWSEAQMELLYSGGWGEAVENPSGQSVHGVYRSAHFPLQHFAMTHPEYEYFWNWEMDMRYLGNFYELFDRLGSWARDQSRNHLWERSAKYYIPAVHGDWKNFTELVVQTTRNAGKRPIMGPVYFPGRTRIRAEERSETFMPASCFTSPGDGSPGVAADDSVRCGVDENADLITLNPIFDAEKSGWVFASDVTGWDLTQPTPPRRCAIVTASRLSRRLLEVMHEETWRFHHSMFSEMFPAAMALHHGLKAVYAPHPVLLDRGWEMEAVDKHFNGGYDNSTSGHGSPFDFQNEHNHKGTSWYYNSEFAGLLWRRWLGYAQMDGRGEDGGRAGEGTLRGGKTEEESPWSTGRLCLRSMLVHPIKWEKPNDG
ncbi:hypothetical protein MGG_11809 [Pyricularia oryzae 70-15]|uniref:Major facilitator superfamily transporter n=3 Tax=Pyricularia oryzae TaxID=318829 RepID=G4MMK6_PYRO7|nr:uncharacterized protein MGG_11809 [Pyricularia oryzae 70-15]EHA56984.1 hypothetical protein MGG_11809 [Pyricularia oryzae 70-15]ELQ43663.1 hypothetical protein OOU_Y34scaffold00140g71 [Pyricularia oryzae Y34]KAI7920817.1 hypothetical protein M9X92_005704 [Pyricularia oryzae]KAI7931008.1 hypothetical protein M0657_001370 [Pyricularia oryzae]